MLLKNFSPLISKRENPRTLEEAGKSSAKAKLVTDFLYVPIPYAAITLECQFNPTQLSITKEASYGGKAIPARDNPRTEYKGGMAATYTLDLVFDAFASNENGQFKRRDVREDCNKLMAMSMKTNGFSTNLLAMPYLMEPASVRFIWGDVQLFRAVLKKVTIKYTKFDSTGAPTHAVANCTFMEQSHPMDFLPAQNPSSRTDPRQTVRVTDGDRLDTIASKFYGDPRMWRSIAQKNDVDDPFNLNPGQLLSMPMDR